MASAYMTAEERDSVPLGSFDTFEQKVAERERSHKALDDAISGATEEVEGRRPETDAELLSNWNSRVRERYGRDAVRVVDEAHGWATRFRADPMTARQEFVSERMRDGFNAFTRFDTDKPAAVADDGDVHSFVKLDRILENAIDRAEAAPQVAETYKTFEQQAAAKLDELFGKDTPRAAQLEALDKYLEAQHADPTMVADRLAAMSGAPVTPLDEQTLQAHVSQEADVATITRELDGLAARGQLVGLNDPQVIQDMVTALQHPQFPRSGDQFQDVVNANKAALQVAASRRAEANRAEVEKAQKAAKVTVSSGGHSVRSSGPETGMDAAIGKALAGFE